MEIKLNDELTLTTNHPMSSYGLGVVVSEDGKVYMPSDLYPVPAPLQIVLGGGNDRTMGEAVLQMVSILDLSDAEKCQVENYLSQQCK